MSGPSSRPAPAAQDPNARIGAELAARRDQLVYVAEQFRRARTPLQVIEVARHADAVTDRAVQTALKEMPPQAPPACREGCSWCCRTPVGAAAPEVLRIVAYLRETLSPEQWEALRQRVRSGVEVRRLLGIDRVRRAALACPLLVEDRCSAYPVRPLTCRGYSSSDALSCERALDPASGVQVPIYWPQQRLAAFVLDGMRAGLAANGIDAELLELTAALQIALETPDVEKRWLSGEKVFAPARLD
jgi:Fe-S-cluster containining protein